MKHKLLALLMTVLALPLFAQQGRELKGVVLNEANREPVVGVVVVLQHQNLSARTDETGHFYFPSVQDGREVLSLNSAKIISKEIPIEIGQVRDLGELLVAVKEMNNIHSLMGVVNELELEDDGGVSQDINAMVILSNDMYLNNIAYQLSPLRFKIRGYDNQYEQKYINGVSFNDQLRGVFSFSSIGALNDVTRNGDENNYLTPSTFSFGSIGRSENINMRSGSYNRGGKITATYTNRNYYLRGMASYATGLRDDGWAFNFTLGGRYADEGVVDGTFYKNFSYAIGAEKQWNNGEHSLSFVTFGSPVERGQQGSSYQEVYDLVGDNLYNPNWGYQDGKKRNSRVVKSFDPTAIFSHVWKPNDKVNLTTGVGAHYSRYGGSALNWYNGPDPRPDYYRYLPSYFENEEVQAYYQDLWRNKTRGVTQIDWDELYMANKRASLAGDDAAVYMVEERRKDLFEVSMNSTLNAQINRYLKFTGGVGVRRSTSLQFKTVDDLLGASHVLDIDKFAERDFPGDQNVIQNDLTKPNRKAYKGDTFGYDFRVNINSANIWLQNQYSLGKVDLYYGTKLTYTDFQRDGKMLNGRYPDSSKGKGKKHDFVDYALKGGLTYKFDGRHFLTANLGYFTEAPLADKAYISPRITDLAPENLKSSRIFSADMSYVFSMPSIHGRVSVFQTNFYDQMHKISYYHDSERTFVNHVLQGMNKVHRGVELGMNYRLNNNWNFDLAGTVAEYYYSNNPDGTINYENGKELGKRETVYLKDYYVGSTPQIAGTLGVNYFYDYWFLSMNINGFGRNYIDISPMRRVASNYQGIQPTDTEQYEAYKKLIDQERYGSGYTVDLSIGKIFYLPGRQSVNFNLSVNNLFNRKNIRTGGYEQGRLDVSNPDKFASKYYYLQGINCFLNASYRF